MTDFTYEVPNEENFLQAVLVRLKENGRNDLAALLAESKCSISNSGQFSRRRWDGLYTTVDFAFPLSKYTEATEKISETDRDLIKEICNDVMPLKNGLDIMEVKLSMCLEEIKKPNAEHELKQIIAELPDKLQSEIIPDDIKNKAKEMSEVYLYSYCAENLLRAFIAKVAQEKLGVDYLVKLKLSTGMLSKISKRKEQVAKKKWLSARGDSDIFYLDIEDLGNLIQNNWEIFKQFFESTQWITTNISEIADCRNVVAHHGYLQKDERDIIRLNFIKILKQISETFK